MNHNAPIVMTKAGKVEGGSEGGVYVFKGIPYAVAPTGKLRWMPPQPVKRWDGVRPTKEYGPVCPQNQLPEPPPGMGSEFEQQSEDCLYLNVWTPGLDDAKRPVMVWIHGGGFIMGSGTEMSVRGGKLPAREDIVMVSINYRLGAFGFINLKEVTGGKIQATGNEGLLDQIAALEWVRDNIAAFGGNPDNITVFGFSAGGMSIGMLHGMKVARGTYHKAIHQSGAASAVMTLEGAVDITGQFIKLLGLKNHDIDALYALSVEKMIWAQQKLERQLDKAEHKLTPFQPVIDGRIVTELPIQSIRRGSIKNIPIMAGTALEDWKMMGALEPGLRDIDDAGLARRTGSMVPQQDKVNSLIEAYRNARSKRGDDTTNYEIFCAIMTDIIFRMPTIELIEAQRDNMTPAYKFLFTWESPIAGGRFGACHGLDLRFVFGTYDDSFCGTGAEADILSERMQDAWASFARTGDPSCDSIGKWPVYGKKRMTMMFGPKCSVEEAPYDEERRAWDGSKMVFTRPI